MFKWLDNVKLEDATTKTEDLVFFKALTLNIYRIYSASNRILLKQIEINDGSLSQHGHTNAHVRKSNGTPFSILLSKFFSHLLHWKHRSLSSCELGPSRRMLILVIAGYSLLYQVKKLKTWGKFTLCYFFIITTIMWFNPSN